MADAFQAFIQLLTDFFAALAAFLGGKNKSLNKISEGLKNNTMFDETTTAE